MAIFKIIKSGKNQKGKLKRLSNYLNKNSLGTSSFNTELINNTLEELQRKMLFFKEISNTEIECRHFVLSFKKDECSEDLQTKVLNDFLNKNKYFKNRFGFHVKHNNENTTHYHIVSTHTTKDFKLENISNKVFYQFKSDLNTTLKSYNLETDLKKLKNLETNREFYTFDKNLEHILKNKLKDSVYYNVALSLIKIFKNKNITTKEDFINECKNYDIIANIDDNRKYVTYTYLKADTKKNKIRCKKLNDMITNDYNFGKDAIYEFLEKNRERNRERIRTNKFNTITRNVYNNDTNIRIQQLSSESSEQRVLREREQKTEESIDFDKLIESLTRRNRRIDKDKQEENRRTEQESKESRRKQEENRKRGETSFIDFDKLFKSDRANENDYSNKRKDDIDIEF